MVRIKWVPVYISNITQKVSRQSCITINRYADTNLEGCHLFSEDEQVFYFKELSVQSRGGLADGD